MTVLLCVILYLKLHLLSAELFRSLSRKEKTQNVFKLVDLRLIGRAVPAVPMRALQLLTLKSSWK